MAIKEEMMAYFGFQGNERIGKKCLHDGINITKNILSFFRANSYL